ncbi:MAG: virginiamycin lyase [Alphaproteobacteria bacterium]|jgi:streptogramin lyase|nr:virginiamycin lyase [Alphaproteobacteria bacterium]
MSLQYASSATATAFVLLLGLADVDCAAAAETALTGLVSSAEEGAMEGVLVSAQKDGSTVRITVVTDAQGGYSFPAAKLEPGHYKLNIRAVGYDLDGATALDIAANSAAKADLKLKKTRNLSGQLNNAEWMASVPDSPQRRLLAGCTNCHTVQRILESTKTSDEFVDIIPRMGKYGAMSLPTRPQIPPNRVRTSELKPEAVRKYADYLASINRSEGPEPKFALKTLPRPSGRATRVIMTEYALPRPELGQPHDVVVDAEGIVWYSHFGEQIVGKLDPKTAKVTEYKLPLLKPTNPQGSLNLELDADGNPWLAMMYQGGIAKLDKKTEKIEVYPLAPEFETLEVQISMVDARHSKVDGKVWFSDAGSRMLYKLDVASGKMEQVDPFKNLPKGSTYGLTSDAKNNLWYLDYGDRSIGMADAATGKPMLYPTPTTGSRPRRGHMDAQGRLAFAEFAADKVGVFDTNTEQFQEWPTPANFAPYDAVLDKNGELWTGGMNSDRILRVDTKTGQSVAYLLPRQTNVRRVFVDNSTSPVTFWVGNNHGGSIIKLEPLD